MKRKILLSLGVLMAIIISYVAYTVTTTKSHSPADVAKYNKNGLSIQVDYCRPYKKGRVLFGESGTTALEIYGEPWRTGANEATEINISSDILFPEGKLNAGNYSLYSIPGKEEWTIAFNSKVNYWGADLTGSPFDPSLDVLRVTVPRLKNDEVIEQFTIQFDDNDGEVKMILLWDDIKVKVPFNTSG